MQLNQILLPEFDEETANTRKVLERVPDHLLGWKAHPKSNTIGWVSMHLADIPRWTVFTLEQDSFDVAPPGQEPYHTPSAQSTQHVLEVFDANVSAARNSLNNVKDDTWFQPWSLLNGGQVFFTMPRWTVMRSFVLNHLVHHRAHLCVYLRLDDIPVPGMYGPSGDASGPE
jgi:uncharacterized damage-inducible protein DinB